MKQSQINKAYMALTKIANAAIPVRESYALFKLMKQLEPIYKFELEHERKLLEKYDCQIAEDGGIVMSAPSLAEDFRREFNELLNLEVEEDIVPIAIQMESLKDVRMTAVDMISLEGFVEFI